MSPSALFVTTVSITLDAFLAPFAEHFRSRGWRVDAMASGASTDQHIAEAFDNRFEAGWCRRLASPGNLAAARTVRQVVQSGDYDIVHVHTPIAAFVSRYALRHTPRGRRPARIYTAHGFHFYEGGSAASNALFRSMERLAAPWTDYLVTINEVDHAAACTLGGIPAERVRLIPGIGVDLDRFDAEAVSPETAAAVREGLGIAEDAFVLTMIAEFAPVKRHAHLFDALARVDDPRVVVVLVGDGPLESSLRERAVALGLADRIRWAGYRRDIPAVLAASDALTLVSEREGLPRSVLEALAAGRPVIGTRTRGIVDAVGDAGWIVDKHDAAALGRAIAHAAAHPDETRELGVTARARAERFALPRIIAAYEELYHEALEATV